jgi:hypothetical protein
LEENGVNIINSLGALTGPYGKFFQAELKTYRSIFPEVRAYAVDYPNNPEKIQNVVLVAFKNGSHIRTTPNDDPAINERLTHEWKGGIESGTPILTDDFAPTDYYVNSFATIPTL